MEQGLNKYQHMLQLLIRPSLSACLKSVFLATRYGRQVYKLRVDPFLAEFCEGLGCCIGIRNIRRSRFDVCRIHKIECDVAVRNLI